MNNALSGVEQNKYIFDTDQGRCTFFLNPYTDTIFTDESVGHCFSIKCTGTKMFPNGRQSWQYDVEEF